MQLHIPRPLELLVDDLIHPAARIQQTGSDDRQRPPFLQVARRPDEPLRRIQRRRVNPPRHRAPRSGQRQVVGPRQPGDAVQQNDHIPPRFRHPFRPFHRQLRHPTLLLHRLVKGGRKHIPLDGPPHLRHLLRPFPNQHYHQQQIRAVFGNRRRNLPQHRRLPRFRRRHYQPPLPQPDGRKQVNHPRRQPPLRMLQRNMPVGENRRQRLKNPPRAGPLRLRLQQIDASGAHQLVLIAPLPVLGRTHLPGDGVPRLQIVPPDLPLLHIGVPGYGRILQRPQQPMPGVHHLQHPGGRQTVMAGGGQLHLLEQRLPIAILRGVIRPRPHFRRQRQQLLHRLRRQFGHINRRPVGNAAVRRRSGRRRRRRAVRRRIGTGAHAGASAGLAVDGGRRAAAGAAGGRGRCGRSRADHNYQPPDACCQSCRNCDNPASVSGCRIICVSTL